MVTRQEHFPSALGVHRGAPGWTGTQLSSLRASGWSSRSNNVFYEEYFLKIISKLLRFCFSLRNSSRNLFILFSKHTLWPPKMLSIMPTIWLCGVCVWDQLFPIFIRVFGVKEIWPECASLKCLPIEASLHHSTWLKVQTHVFIWRALDWKNRSTHEQVSSSVWE